MAKRRTRKAKNLRAHSLIDDLKYLALHHKLDACRELQIPQAQICKNGS